MKEGVEMKEILQDLNKKQLEAVTYKDGPLLVIAGPGTGKTRVITHRIPYLIGKHGIKPESILAITFTNKSAQEMLERVNKLIGETVSSKVKICTFHAFCNRILRMHASEIGLDEDFRILDKDEQDELLTRIVQEMNLRSSDYKSIRMLSIISNLKGNLKEPTETTEFYDNGLPILEEEDIKNIKGIVKRYQTELEDLNVLDYDDLLLKVSELLNECSEIRESYQNEISYVLVDEFHDVNFAQYRLLQHICKTPEQSDLPNIKPNIMIVGDKDQAIYSWRGSDTKYIEKFKEDFKPHIIGLEEHYRCTKMILNASKAVIANNTDSERPSLFTNNKCGDKIVHCTFHDSIETQEAQSIIRLIRNLKAKDIGPSGKQDPSNTIAILYRNHRFANILAEQLALIDEFNFRQWVQDTSPFQEDFNQAIVFYLSLVVPKYSYRLDHAINFPEVSIDEFTFLQMRKLARKKNTDLIDLLKHLDAYKEEIGPLTRQRIQRFWNHINRFENDIDIENDSANSVVQKLLDTLELLRSPYRCEEIKMLANNQDDLYFADVIDILSKAVEQGERIYITAKYGIDEYCTAHILNHTFNTYLDRHIQVQYLLPNAKEPTLPEKGVNILVGDFGELDTENSEANIIIVGTSDSLNPQILHLNGLLSSNDISGIDSVKCVTALKLCQRLVGRYEIHNMNDVVVYDLETTGLNPDMADIIQIAACRLNTDGDICDAYEEFVKPPNGEIPEEIEEITKITKEMIEKSPTIKAELPNFCNFVQDSILVGHNIAEYDNIILQRDLKDYLNREFTNLYYDTLVVARRLFPNEKRSLEALAGKFGIEYNRDEAHRADKDIKVNRRIFKELISVESKNLQTKSLTELLPFVGCGILAKTETFHSKKTSINEKIAFNQGEMLTHINNIYLNAAKRYIQTYSRQKRLSDIIRQSDFLLLEETEKSKVRSMIIQLSKDKIQSTPEDLDWKKARADVQNNVRRFEKISNDKRLQRFIEYQTRMIDAVRRFEKINNDRVYLHEKSNRLEEQLTLMSLHTAKGTEFDYVIIIGMEHGVFPRVWNWNPEAIEEERRLFYVGMTRAKKRLYLCTDMFRYLENNTNGFIAPSEFEANSNIPIQIESEFIDEIPSDNLQKWPTKKSE